MSCIDDLLVTGDIEDIERNLHAGSRKVWLGVYSTVFFKPDSNAFIIPRHVAYDNRSECYQITPNQFVVALSQEEKGYALASRQWGGYCTVLVDDPHGDEFRSYHIGYTFKYFYCGEDAKGEPFVEEIDEHAFVVLRDQGVESFLWRYSPDQPKEPDEPPMGVLARMVTGLKNALRAA